jgi:hypothetical protein
VGLGVGIRVGVGGSQATPTVHRPLHQARVDGGEVWGGGTGGGSVEGHVAAWVGGVGRGHTLVHDGEGRVQQRVGERVGTPVWGWVCAGA